MNGRKGTRIAGVRNASFPAAGSRSQRWAIRPARPPGRSMFSSACATHWSTPIWVELSGMPGVFSLTGLHLLQCRRPQQPTRPHEHHADQDPEDDQVGDVAVQVAAGPGLDETYEQAAEHRARDA